MGNGSINVHKENIRLVPCIMDDLTELGINAGDCLIVHSSFKSLGLKNYSPSDVIATFLHVLGNEGTLVMPVFSYSYEGVWECEPFNPGRTPGMTNGILTETMRKLPEALRSSHPTYSVAAIGKYAEVITKNKKNESALGIGSSYHEAYLRGSKILLMGVGNDSNSMLHYAEAAAGLPYMDIPFREFWGRTALVEREGQILQVPLKNEFPACSDNFQIVDGYLEKRGILKRGKVSMADSILMDAKEMVDAVVEKLMSEPAWLLCSNITCEPCTLRKRQLKAKGLI